MVERDYSNESRRSIRWLEMPQDALVERERIINNFLMVNMNLFPKVLYYSSINKDRNPLCVIHYVWLKEAIRSSNRVGKIGVALAVVDRKADRVAKIETGSVVYFLSHPFVKHPYLQIDQLISKANIGIIKQGGRLIPHDTDTTINY